MLLKGTTIFCLWMLHGGLRSRLADLDVHVCLKIQFHSDYVLNGNGTSMCDGEKRNLVPQTQIAVV